MRIEKGKQRIRNLQSEIRNNWADAFCGQRPCPRATRKGILKMKAGKGKEPLEKDFPPE